MRILINCLLCVKCGRFIKKECIYKFFYSFRLYSDKVSFGAHSGKDMKVLDVILEVIGIPASYPPLDGIEVNKNRAYDKKAGIYESTSSASHQTN